MKITFILPSVGRKDGQKKYIKTWCMEPLAIAQLAALTPPDIQTEFFDDRLEKINYDTTTDLVAINIEAYTAKRAYEIAEQYKKRGKQIVMGGFHATLMPEEVREHADAVVVGEAEGVWLEVINDYQSNQLKKIYQSKTVPSLEGILPDRSIYQNKKFLKLGLMETGRGCNYN